MLSGSLTPSQWSGRLAEFNYSCAYCLDASNDLTADHMIALSRGGANSIDNIVPACRSCNSKKGAKTIFSMLGR